MVILPQNNRVMSVSKHESKKTKSVNQEKGNRKSGANLLLRVYQDDFFFRWAKYSDNPHYPETWGLDNVYCYKAYHGMSLL